MVSVKKFEWGIKCKKCGRTIILDNKKIKREIKSGDYLMYHGYIYQIEVIINNIVAIKMSRPDRDEIGWISRRLAEKCIEDLMVYDGKNEFIQNR